MKQPRSSHTDLPRNLYRAADVQALDRVAIDKLEIPGFELMQRAGSVAFNSLMERWPQVRHLLVFAGAGNNGGDGYIVAGLAREQGIGVDLVQLAPAEKLKGDASRACEWAAQKQVSFTCFGDFNPDHMADHANVVIVDALFGTGLVRAIEGDYASAVDWINQSGLPVLAVDVPSGLNADSGVPLGPTVAAQMTVTFIGMKQGLLTGQAGDYTGNILFHDLDEPERLYTHADAPSPSAVRIDINDASRYLLPRPASSHKGHNGHVLVLGGDERYGGAVILASEAAQRSGAGLVSVVTRSCHRDAILAQRPEVMVMGTEDESYDFDALLERANVIVVGPGLGRGKWGSDLLQLALAAQVARDIPLVIDADGLQLLADKQGTGARLRRDNWVLTPHPGEASTLLGRETSEIQQDRFAAVAELQSTWGGACLLKGNGSLICGAESPSSIYLCSEGNPGMGSGGMGDVLSGLLGGLIAQGLPLLDALQCGVCIHGEAADLASAEHGERGLAASDLFRYIQQLVNPKL